MSRRRGDRVQGHRAYGGVLVIPCQLNDAYRYWFLVDTGTAITMLSRRVTEEIGLDLSSPVRHEDIASVHQVTRAPVLRLSSLQVGSQRATDIEVLVLSLPPDLRVDGLLGVNFLGLFRPTFEFDQGILVLR
ncbi:MAG: retropepsin-like domain-containing protein [Proteobacteria bacterium]|nr:retropepsin-like domain-containing protein [Pseudomonadota bacterium]